jgi:hypothetical protein
MARRSVKKPRISKSFHDDITVQLEALDLHMRAQLHTILEYHATRAQSSMRQNAPWRDQTGNARNGLFATVQDEARGGGSIVLYHSVAYGIYLETRWAGRYAIILPTIQTEGRLVMTSVAALFGTR